MKSRVRVDVEKEGFNKIVLNFKYNYWLDIFDVLMSFPMLYMYVRTVKHFDISKLKITKIFLTILVFLKIAYLLMIIYVYQYIIIALVVVLTEILIEFNLLINLIKFGNLIKNEFKVVLKKYLRCMQSLGQSHYRS